MDSRLYGLVFIGVFLFTGGILLAVFFLIRHVVGLNKAYERFAAEYGYQFELAQGTYGYRDYSKHVTREYSINLFQSPYVEKYAAFKTYPFSRGGKQAVAYVISGQYKASTFRAFTYSFVGSRKEQSGPGGIFSIVMLGIGEQPVTTLPENVFYERGYLVHVLKENLDVETIHERLDWLRKFISVRT